MKKLTLTTSLLSLSTAIVLSMTGCSGGSSADAVSGAVGVVSSGIAIDGILVGSTVCIDANKNASCDSGEPTTLTGADGKFTLPATTLTGPLLLIGGTDLSTNAPFTGKLKAPAGSTVVSPLTSAVQALVESGSTAEEAQTNVKAAMGLSGVDVNLTSFDPYNSVSDANITVAQNAQKVLAQQTKLQVLIHTISASVAGADSTNGSISNTMSSAFSEIVKDFNGSAVDLNTTVVEAAIKNVATTVYVNNEVAKVAAQAVAASAATTAVAAAIRAEDTITNATLSDVTAALDDAIENVNVTVASEVITDVQTIVTVVQAAEDANESLEDAAATLADTLQITAYRSLIASLVTQTEEDANATRLIANTYVAADTNATTAEDALNAALAIKAEVYAYELVDLNVTYVATKKAEVQVQADIAAAALKDAVLIRLAVEKAARIALIVSAVNLIDVNVTAELALAATKATEVQNNMDAIFAIAELYSTTLVQANDANISASEAAAAYMLAQTAATDIADAKTALLAAQTAADEVAALTAQADAVAAKATFDAQLAIAYAKAAEVADLLVEIEAIRDAILTATVPFTTQMISGNSFYSKDFSVATFTDSYVTFLGINPEESQGAIPYIIDANGHLVIGGETVVELLEVTTDYVVMRIDGKVETLYTSEAALLAATVPFSGSEISVSDDLNDSMDASSRAGNELSGLSVRLDDANNSVLVITVTASGGIQEALASAPYDVNYSNVIWIDINNYLEFGLLADGAFFNQDIYTDGNFTNGTPVSSGEYSYTVSGSTLTLNVPLSLLNSQSLLYVKAQIGSDLNNAFDSQVEVSDDVTYDEVALGVKWADTVTWPDVSSPLPTASDYLSSITNGTLTVLYDVYDVISGDSETSTCSKHVVKVEFGLNNSFVATRVTVEPNETFTTTYSISGNVMTVDGATTTYTAVSGQSYIMTGVWDNGSGEVDDTNRYFTLESAAMEYAGCTSSPTPTPSSPDLVAFFVGKTVYGIQNHEVGGDDNVSNDGLPYGHTMRFDNNTLGDSTVYSGHSGGIDEWGAYGIDANLTDHSYIIDGNELRSITEPDQYDEGGRYVIVYVKDVANNGKEFNITSYTYAGVLQGTSTGILYPTAADRDAAMDVGVVTNTPPVAQNDVYLTMLVGESVSGVVSATDADTNDTLTFTPTSLSGSFGAGTDLNTTTGAFTIVAGDVIGQSQIVVTVSDEANASDEVTFNVNIIAANSSTYVGSEYEYSNPDEIMGLALYTDVSSLAIPGDTKFYSFWGTNSDGTLMQDSMEFNTSNHEAIFSENNGIQTWYSGDLSGETAISSGGTAFDSNNVMASMKMLEVISDEANISSELNITMPTGAVAYKVAVRMYTDEYNFWGEAKDYTQDQNGTVYNSLDAFVVEGRGVVYNQMNNARMLVFDKNATLASSGGNLVELDISGWMNSSGAEPFVVNANAGTWSLITNQDVDSGNAPIVLVTPNNTLSYQSKIYVLNDFGINGNTTNTVWEGSFRAADRVEVMYDFNDIAAQAIIDNFNAIHNPFEALSGIWKKSVLRTGIGAQWRDTVELVNNEGNVSREYALRSDGTNTVSSPFNFVLDADNNLTRDDDLSNHGTYTLQPDLIVDTRVIDPTLGKYHLDIMQKVDQSVSYVQSDLEGVWYKHVLRSGAKAQWRYRTETIDVNGDVTRTSIVRSDGKTDLGSPYTMTVFSDGNLSRTDDMTQHGFMSPNKDMMVSVKTIEDKNETYPGTYHLEIMQKFSQATFSAADLAGKWRYHAIRSGTAADVIIGSVEIDNLANVTQVHKLHSDGTTTIGADYAFTVATNGELTRTDKTTAHGLISSDKKVMIVTSTKNDDLSTNTYELRIYQRVE